MTLFIDVQGVPNAILDLVKARILANRKRSKERGLAAVKSEQQQPARRRYYSPLAPDRRPEPAGIPQRSSVPVGMFWLYDQFQGGTQGISYWATPGLNPSWTTDDVYRFKIGSGDGTQWVTASIDTPGLEAMRAAAAADVASGGPGPRERRIRGVARITALPLPCGKGAAVVLVRAERAAAFSGWWGEEAFDYPGNPLMYWKTYSYAPRTASARGFKVFLVSHTSCRELTPPAGFADRVATLFPPVQWGNSEVWTYRPTYEPGVAVGLGPRPNYAIEPEPISIPAPNFSSLYGREYPYTYTVLKPAGGSYNSSGVFVIGGTPVEFTGVNVFSPAEIALGNQLLSSFGFKVDLMTDALFGYWETNTTTAPSVLPFFADQPAALTAAVTLWDDGETTYAAHSAALSGLGQSPPSVVITIDHRTPQMQFVNDSVSDEPLYYATTEEVDSIPFVTHTPLPTTGSDTLSSEAEYKKLTALPFRATRVDPFEGDTVDLDFPYLLTPIFYTDWGKPAYCRQQLLAMGFTDADMRP